MLRAAISFKVLSLGNANKNIKIHGHEYYKDFGKKSYSLKVIKQLRLHVFIIFKKTTS